MPESRIVVLGYRVYTTRIMLFLGTDEYTSEILDRFGHLCIIDDCTGSMLGFVSSIVFDALVLVFTVSSTLALAKQSKRLGMQNNISYIMLRDGEYMRIRGFLNLTIDNPL